MYLDVWHSRESTSDPNSEHKLHKFLAGTKITHEHRRPMKPDKKEGREKSHIFLCNDTINRINSSIICSLSVTKMTLDRLDKDDSGQT